MRFNIFDGKTLINIIEASEAFCVSYCERNGYTFEKVPEEPTPEIEPEPTTEQVLNTLLGVTL